jgi:hypothetical protein
MLSDMHARNRMSRPRQHSRLDRIVTSAFGLLLLGLAIAIILLTEGGMSTGPLLVSAVLAALGLDALISVARNRRSLLSRIGPLP